MYEAGAGNKLCDDNLTTQRKITLFPSILLATNNLWEYHIFALNLSK